MSKLSNEMKALAEKATPGPWTSDNADDDVFMGAMVVEAPHMKPRANREPDHGDIVPHQTVAITLLQSPRACEISDEKWEINAEFIARCRTAVPDLCAEVETLEARVKTLELAIMPFAKWGRLFSGFEVAPDNPIYADVKPSEDGHRPVCDVGDLCVAANVMKVKS